MLEYHLDFEKSLVLKVPMRYMSHQPMDFDSQYQLDLCISTSNVQILVDCNTNHEIDKYKLTFQGLRLGVSVQLVPICHYICTENLSNQTMTSSCPVPHFSYLCCTSDS